MKKSAIDKAKEFASENRKQMPPAEALLWKEFKTWGNRGIVFRRQHAINMYIVDFAHIRSKTIIEVDGKSHDGARAGYDAQRQQLLE